MKEKKPIVFVSLSQIMAHKMHCTLQLCISPEEPQRITPAIIFRRKGKVMATEQAQYDKRFHVFFQEKAWMDKNAALQWVKKTYVPFDDKRSEKVLFLDN